MSSLRTKDILSETSLINGFALCSVHKMDYAGLSKLNVKTLRGYLLSYNITTQGMLEKQGMW